ncbi:MAG: enoyl-CoA hydratase [Sneathiellaceae bacterium]
MSGERAGRASGTEESHLRVAQDAGRAGVRRITIDRPEKLNAVGFALAGELRDAFLDCAGQDGLRCVVLAGAGKAFIGGADLTEMAGLDAAGARRFITGLHQVCAAIRACPVPVIAEIGGHCLGGGLEIAAACDLRIAADTALFGMPEVRVGIPSVIEAALLPRLIGWGRCQDILLTGRTFSAQDAHDWGFLSAVAPAAGLAAAVEGRLDEILAGGAAALRLQKRLLTRWEELALSDAVEAGIDSFADAYAGSDEPQRMMGAALAEMAARRRARQGG